MKVSKKMMLSSRFRYTEPFVRLEFSKARFPANQISDSLFQKIKTKKIDEKSCGNESEKCKTASARDLF